MCDTKWYTPIEKSLGSLPEKPTPSGHPAVYSLPADVPASAKTVLLYAFATTHNEGAFERGYYIFYTKEGAAKYKMYMNIATGTPAVAINSMNVWLPVTSDRKLYVELVHPEDKCVAHKAAGGKANEEWGNLFVTGFH